MAKLQLENVPDELLKRLELAAAARNRDLKGEVLERLDESFGPVRVSQRRSHAELSELARSLRGDMVGAWLTPEFVRMAREWGRE